MALGTNSELPNPFDFAQIWAGYTARTQRVQADLLDAGLRLAEVRLATGAEAYMETFGYMIAFTAPHGLAPLFADCPVRMQSAQARAQRVQQAHLDFWAHSMKATADVFTQAAVDHTSSGANAQGYTARGQFIERRTSAEVINFADRRARLAGDGAAESRGGVGTGVSPRHRASAQRR